MHCGSPVIGRQHEAQFGCVLVGLLNPGPPAGTCACGTVTRSASARVPQRGVAPACACVPTGRPQGGGGALRDASMIGVPKCARVNGLCASGRMTRESTVNQRRRRAEKAVATTNSAGMLGDGTTVELMENVASKYAPVEGSPLRYNRNDSGAVHRMGRLFGVVRRSGGPSLPRINCVPGRLENVPREVESNTFRQARSRWTIPSRCSEPRNEN